MRGGRGAGSCRAPPAAVSDPSGYERGERRYDRQGKPQASDRTPGVLTMLEGVDEAGDPHDEDEDEIDERPRPRRVVAPAEEVDRRPEQHRRAEDQGAGNQPRGEIRSEEHTSELQ